MKLRLIGRCFDIKNKITMQLKRNNSGRALRKVRRLKSKGGRPRKFTEPSRPITVTLPDSTLEQLARIDRDRALAIAKAARMAGGTDVEGPEPDVCMLDAGNQRALIIVRPNRYLRRLDCLNLVEVSRGRCLITTRTGTPSTVIEVGLRDMLELVPRSETRERAMLEELAGIFRRTRQLNSMDKQEILIIPHEDR